MLGLVHGKLAKTQQGQRGLGKVDRHRPRLDRLSLVKQLGAYSVVVRRHDPLERLNAFD